uniref:Uncharacterized protein n=1 Tax=Anguilla anguilla TaxID=7936 RepID=A0A0E9SXS0_ANGAN
MLFDLEPLSWFTLCTVLPQLTEITMTIGKHLVLVILYFKCNAY